MFREIFRFEVAYHLRSPVFWLATAVMALLSFGAVTTDAIQVGGSIGNVNRNAPYVIMQVLMVMSAVGVFATTAFVAGAVLRDFEHGTHELFFSTSIKKRCYLFGRFLGALTAAVLLYIPVALSIIIGSFMPWIETERLGPFLIAPYLFSFGVFVLPSVFLLSAVFFALATLTRSMLYTYGGLVAFFVGYAVSQTLLGDIENENLASIVDPFGFGTFQLATKYWTTMERNSQVLPLEGALLLNRLLWLGVGLVFLALTYGLFSFTIKESGKLRKGLQEASPAAKKSTPTSPRAPTPGLAPSSGSTALLQFWCQTRQELRSNLRSLPFLIILALGVFNLVGNATGLDQSFGTPVYPRTYLLIQTIQSGFLLFALIIVTFYSGEMVHRERSLKLDEIYDALPVPNWVFWGSKLVALSAVVFVLLVVAIVTAMGIQLYRGYSNFELGLYLQGVLLLVGIPFVLIGVLALFLQVLTNNKYVGFLGMVLYFISLPVLSALHYEHNLYRYASAPSAPYSDMNGFGHFVEPVAWFYVYWALFAVILVTLMHLLWVRGKEARLRMRLALFRQRLTRSVAAALGIAVLGFVAIGSWIYYNTAVLNPYIPGNVQELRQARYEKEYKQYEGIAQPRILTIHANVDIFPRERTVEISGRYLLRNKTNEAIEKLHLTLNPRLDIEDLSVAGGVLENRDEEMGYSIYRLTAPLLPGDESEVRFELAARNEGFVNHDSNTRIVYNGTFIDSGDYFPHIGYSRGGELGDPNERRRHDLPPIQRLPKIDDEAAWGTHQLGSDGDWIEFETVVSTSEDQVALAPGYLQREWKEEGRRYFHYKMDSLILPFVAYLSAAWEVKKDRWQDVEIAIYYHAEHSYNVDRMIDATKKSLDYFTQNFGPYQHRQFRIIEFPRYARFAQSFPNTIPFSESIGFIARLDDPDDIDYVFYVTAHELAHQWWAHQVIGAQVQGATVMVETMAQYSALMVMEKEYGQTLMRKFLKYELDRYLRGRGGELIEELPLWLVENQPYIHYSKGSLATYALRDFVGESALNEAFARYVKDVKFGGPPYTTTREYLSYVRAAVPEDQQSIVEDLFETITLFDNTAKEANYQARSDGTYLVRITAESHKFRADGQGDESEVPVDDWIDVAVFGEREEGDPPEGKVLFMEKRHVNDSDMAFEVIVGEKPRQAGIDPFNKLIDRNPKNNLVSVKAGEGPPAKPALEP